MKILNKALCSEKWLESVVCCAVYTGFPVECVTGQNITNIMKYVWCATLIIFKECKIDILIISKRRHRGLGL